MDQININIDSPEKKGRDYDSAIALVRSLGIPDTDCPTEVFTKIKGTNEGRPIIGFKFDVATPEGEIRSVIRVMTVRNFLTLAGLVEGAHKEQL